MTSDEATLYQILEHLKKEGHEPIGVPSDTGNNEFIIRIHCGDEIGFGLLALYGIEKGKVVKLKELFKYELDDFKFL